MTDHWDEFSKSLAEKTIPRRESLRLLGAALAGAALGQFGLGTARAALVNPCKAFCNRCPTKAQKNQCLTTCKACNNNLSRMCGSCGAYACCGAGSVCCDAGNSFNANYCADLASDFDNCGACNAACADPSPYEDGACVDGQCFYWCVEGATDCGGTCTDLGADPYNCGACGNICGGSTPYCIQGACRDSEISCSFPFIPCGGVCVDPTSDPNNCGGCGFPCSPWEACLGGFCESA